MPRELGPDGGEGWGPEQQGMLTEELEIRPLTAERLEDYLRFFDHDAFPDNPAWAGCYCYAHHFAGSNEAWEARSAAENRREVSELILAGRQQGVLAYRGPRVVGWCQASLKADLPVFFQSWARELSQAADEEPQGTGILTASSSHPRSAARG